MSEILDRYLVREIALPFVLALVVLTFVLMIPPILQRGARQLIAKGVEWSIVARRCCTLLPQALSLTIPMAVLLGILVGFGRLSADREFVAMQACGVSLCGCSVRWRSWPSLGDRRHRLRDRSSPCRTRNQTFREITFGVWRRASRATSSRGCSSRTSRNRVIYVRDLPPGGGWRDVFLADTSQAGSDDGVLRARGADPARPREAAGPARAASTARSHTTSVGKPEDYEGSDFDASLIIARPERRCSRRPPPKGAPEMTFAELRASIAEARATERARRTRQRFMIQQKFVAAG